MPKYVKFLREVMSRRKRIQRFERFNLNAECTTVVPRRVPPKLKDLGSFTIPIDIGGFNFGKALYDLRPSTNLIPLSIYRRLGLGDLRETPVTLQLVDRSLVHPKRVLDDVSMRVRHFILPINFIVLNFEEDVEIPILLGRLFLATSKATIDADKGEMMI
ncbi:uncharacterized protein LOC105778982 [Gossypium raimondii]|uniref:uncharacterized protein LOC105778982 n=1 Tax=Gossypium raimondii TaxID=29730 RepID=UPI00063A8C9E|nr:uncharacterized protein LOC105778982 [Gossypium raimondii]